MSENKAEIVYVRGGGGGWGVALIVVALLVAAVVAGFGSGLFAVEPRTAIEVAEVAPTALAAPLPDLRATLDARAAEAARRQAAVAVKATTEAAVMATIAALPPTPTPRWANGQLDVVGGEALQQSADPAPASGSSVRKYTVIVGGSAPVVIDRGTKRRSP